MSKPNNPPNVFNRVYNVPRTFFRLSFEEYCIIDTIYEMSKKRFRYHPIGWCYASKGYFAKILNINRVSVHRIIKKLIDNDLLIKGEAIINKVVPLRADNVWKSEAMFSEKDISTSYSNIYHRPRVLLGLSCAEYCILDTIYQLQSKVEFVWHPSTKRWIAEKIKIPYSTFCRLFDYLIHRKLITLEEQYGEWTGTQYRVVDEFGDVISNRIRCKEMKVSYDINGERTLIYDGS